MRILHLSAYDLMGGAAKAAFRLHGALVEAGEDSLMLVRRKDSARADVFGPEGLLRRVGTKVQRRAEKLLVMPRTTGEFSVGSLPDGLVERVRALKPDIVHVHWVSHGFLRLETLAKLGVPVVWTMHDMWPFTGGCHYSGACTRYEVGCGMCPMLERPTENDVSREGVMRRQAVFKRSTVHFVSPSGWLAECARTSAAASGAVVSVIPNTLDIARFSPRDRVEARRRLGLPLDAVLLLAGSMEADNPRKGAADFFEAVTQMSVKTPGRGPQVVVFGTSLTRRIERDGVCIHELGQVGDEARMADVYAACDVFVVPSKQDNLPNTVMEAMAVGVPVIAYRTGGIPEMVDDGRTGLLVEPGDVSGLAGAMRKLCDDDALRRAMGAAARDTTIKRYAPAVVTGAYRTLYAKLGARS